jgi:5-enolpyruvylshikimate-3-phosphate synthase
LTASGDSVVRDADCIDTSFPDFYGSLLGLTGQSLTVKSDE